MSTSRPGQTGDLHSLITGTVLLKLKADLQALRVCSRPDLVACTYFHIRRYMLIQPGWACRLSLDTPAGPADLALYHERRFRALLQLEFQLAADAGDYFPASLMEKRINAMRRVLNALEGNHPGRAYLIGVFSSAERWLYPDEADLARQTCFWLPLNCRDLPDYSEWRSHWLRSCRSP